MYDVIGIATGCVLLVCLTLLAIHNLKLIKEIQDLREHILKGFDPVTPEVMAKYEKPLSEPVAKPRGEMTMKDPCTCLRGMVSDPGCPMHGKPSISGSIRFPGGRKG
jgi:hypothetical protein